MSQKRLNASITIGGSITGALKSAFSSASSSVTKLGNEITQLNQRNKELNKTITEQEKLGRMGSALKVQYATQEIGQINKKIEALKKQQAIEQSIVGARNRNMAAKAEIRGQIVGAVAMGAMAVAPVAVAIKFETAMLGVAKQLDGAVDASGKLTAVYYDMATSVKQLGRELPIPVNQIAEMVTAGLRMGVSKDQVIDFVKEAAKMSTAFDLPAGDLADQMGKIAVLYKVPIPAISQLADTINYLDDNAISKGGDIIDFMQRVGGVAGAIKISGANMAALGSSLLTMGNSPETAATSTEAMIQKLAAADKGTKKFKSAVAELHLSTAALQKGMQTDAMGTILRVMDAINKLHPEKRLGVLVEMFGLEHSKNIAKLAVNTAELRKQIDLANSAAAKGSMDREFARRMATTAAQIEVAKNRVAELAGNLGSILLPSVNSTLGALGPMVTTMAEWSEKHPRITKGIVTLGTAFVTMRVGILAARYAWLTLSGLMLTNPVTAGITAVAAGAILIMQNWEPVKGFFISLWTDITGAFNLAMDDIMRKIEWVTQKYQTIKDSVSGFFERGEQWKQFKEFGGQAFLSLERQLDTTGSPSAFLPPTPPPAQRGGQYTYNNQPTIHVTQQPGENAKELAERVVKEIKDNRGGSGWASMLDGAYAQ